MMRTPFTKLLLMTLFLLCGTIPAAAQTGGGFNLTWSTIDGGGGTASGGGFALNGTVGQPDAGTLSGGGFQLTGGFWQPIANTPTAIMLAPQNGAKTDAVPLALLGIFSLALAVLSLFITVRHRKSTSVILVEAHNETEALKHH